MVQTRRVFLTSLQLRVAQRLVRRTAVAELAREDDDFVDSREAAFEIGVLLNKLAQLFDSFGTLPHAADRQVRAETAVLGAITELRQLVEELLSDIKLGGLLVIRHAKKLLRQPDECRPTWRRLDADLETRLEACSR